MSSLLWRGLFVWGSASRARARGEEEGFVSIGGCRPVKRAYLRTAASVDQVGLGHQGLAFYQ